MKDINWLTLIAVIAITFLSAVVMLVFKAPTSRLLMPVIGILLLGYLSYVYFSSIKG